MGYRHKYITLSGKILHFVITSPKSKNRYNMSFVISLSVWSFYTSQRTSRDWDGNTLPGYIWTKGDIMSLYFGFKNLVPFYTNRVV